MSAERRCNGGPSGSGWCGAPATHVARDEDGLEWFCCHQHTEGAGKLRPPGRLLPLDEWRRLFMSPPDTVETT